jgi:hypothetical protein
MVEKDWRRNVNQGGEVIVSELQEYQTAQVDHL